MRAVCVPEAGADFQVVEVEIPEPGPGEVRIKVEACGICHSDVFVKEGSYPGVSYPRIPGHEVIGVVDAVGDDVKRLSRGDRVGVGWHGGHCFRCDACRAGDFILCENAEITGLTFDGGYAEYMVAPEHAVASVPEGMEAAPAAPLLCAGITVFNAMRNAGLRPGDLVAVQGLGGLGHLAVQYAARSGYEVVAISTSSDKASLAKELGAHHFINAKEEKVSKRLRELGGAALVLATAPSASAIESVIGGIGRNGKVIVVGVPESAVEVPIGKILGKRGAVGAWASGDAFDSEQTLKFSHLTDTMAMIETFPLEEAATAYKKMLDNEVRFRAVLVIDG